MFIFFYNIIMTPPNVLIPQETPPETSASPRKVVERETSLTVQEVFGAKPGFASQISALSDKDISNAPPPTSIPSQPDNGYVTPLPEERKVTYRSQLSAATSGTNKTSITFGAQVELPPLPIPSLDETLNKFLKSLEALQEDEDERAEAQRVVLEFIKTKGPELQELLLEYDRKGRDEGDIGSYVEEFWNDSYLAPDASVVLNLNPFFVLEDSPDPKIAKHPIKRAASLTFASVKLASQLRFETLKPDTHRGKPLCMDQFKLLFGASRTPMRNSKDAISVFDNSNHVAVMCGYQLYYFQALWPDGDVAVDEGDLVDILSAIHSHAQEADPVQRSQQALGVLTSLSRNEWAMARDELLINPKNQDSLQIIDSALFVLVLDDYIPKDKHDAASNMLHGSYELKQSPKTSFADYQTGSCCNRWYDKLQIIVCGDGTAGINFEHSSIDGHTALRFVSDIYAETVISFAQSITKLVQAHDMIPNVIQAKVRRAAVTLDHAGRNTLDVFPKRIPLELPDSVQRKIYFAETALGDEIVASETHVLEFKDYGKTFITGNKLSPDSYVQMSMMLAYYKLYGRSVCAYEPVMTKSFYHGRTEAMRPATPESKHLCEIFCNPKSIPESKLAALRNATKVHSQLVKEAARGKGVDRHLFALRCIAEKYNMPVPDFFKSAPWKKLNHTVLSTSNCGNPSLALFGFGPVVPDGLGIGYIIKDSQIHYSISSKHRQTTRYACTLDSVLKDMARLMAPSSSSMSHAKVKDRHTTGRASLKSIPLNMISYDSYGDIWGESTPPTSPRPQIKAAAVPEINLDDTAALFLKSGIDDDKVDLSPMPEVLSEEEKPIKRRWAADTGAVSEDEDLEIVLPLKGEDERPTPTLSSPSKEEVAKPKATHTRRGSNDLIPTAPSRRGSRGGTGMVGPIHRKASLEYKELSQKGFSIDMEKKRTTRRNGGEDEVQSLTIEDTNQETH
jgi:carnitine O-acetyltransferase